MDGKNRMLRGLGSLFFVVLLACGEQKEAAQQIQDDNGTFVDVRDGTSYQYIQIGTTDWMVENVRYQDNRGVDYYVEKANNDEEFGGYYGMQDITSICPKGWQMPSYEHLRELIHSLAGETLAERGGKKVPAGSLTDLRLQYGGLAQFEKESVSFIGTQNMAVLPTVSDTVFNFDDEARKGINGKKFSIGLHIYAANKAKDSFMIEPTYDDGIKKRWYNCRCVRLSEK